MNEQSMQARKVSELEDIAERALLEAELFREIEDNPSTVPSTFIHSQITQTLNSSEQSTPMVYAVPTNVKASVQIPPPSPIKTITSSTTPTSSYNQPLSTAVCSGKYPAQPISYAQTLPLLDTPRVATSSHSMPHLPPGCRSPTRYNPAIICQLS